jgi:phospholipase C
MPDGTTPFVPNAPLKGAKVDENALRERLEHVIVLMLENRSFDHQLGFLDHPYPDAFGQRGLGEQFNMTTGDPAEKVLATPHGEPNLVDPNHGPAGVLEQIGAFRGVKAMGGFVKNYDTEKPGQGRKIMQCLDPEVQCPVLAGLAKDFAVCTRWFSSVPGETWPNRNFAHAATSDAASQIEVGFYNDPTIFERLEAGHQTWHIYYDGPPQVWFFGKLWKPRLRDLLPNRKGRLANWYAMPRFFEHVLDGNLPAYSFIEPAHNHIFEDKNAPRQTNSQHCHNNFGDPAAADFRAGERLIAEIYDALLGRPELFARTLLVITYDEHGGLYDHVEPPKTVDPGDPSGVGFIRWVGRNVRAVVDKMRGADRPGVYDPTRLGARVPAVLVSPWIQPGRIVPDVFDHSSIPASLRAMFAPHQKPLTARDAEANTFHQVVADEQSVAGSTPRQLADDHPGNLPPLRFSSAFLSPAGDGVAVDAVVAPGTTPPTKFDVQLARMGDQVGQELERSQRFGVLRVNDAQSKADEEEVAADAVVAGSAAPASPLAVFVDSVRMARNS